MSLKKVIFCFLLTSWLSLMSACGPAPADTTLPSPTVAQVTRAGELTPFASPTPSVTPSPADPSTATPLPTPTPTPRTHAVEKGEDMFGISLRYRVSLEELNAANPTVQPNMLSIGTVLVIPYSETPMPGAETPGAPGTITPIPLQAERVTCTRVEDGGAWCFQQVRNLQGIPVENVSAVFRITDNQANTVLTETAHLLLDVLPAGASLPLAAYFPPPLPDPFLAGGELLTVLPHPDDGRYLPTRLENQKVLIDENGLAAQVSVDVALDIQDSAAQRVWVVAAAYDAQGNVVGIRRWENENASPLQSGEALPVELSLYSIAGPIERIEILAEARP